MGQTVAFPALENVFLHPQKSLLSLAGVVRGVLVAPLWAVFAGREVTELHPLLCRFQAKQKVDAYHLQLQNLLYEVMHLQKEITKCLEFK